MKLTYTIPNLSVLAAAELEESLNKLGLEFQVRPSNESTIPAPETGGRTRRTMSQAEVVELYRTIKDDEQAGRRAKTLEYAERFGVCSSTVLLIARGEHALIPEAVKAEYRKDRPTERTETTEGGKEPGPEVAEAARVEGPSVGMGLAHMG